MKHNPLRAGKLLAVSAVLVVLLTSWSPPSGDHLVVVGPLVPATSGNDLDGFTGNIPNGVPGVAISTFRGMVAGYNNYVGTSTSGHVGLVVGNSNFGNTYWSFIGGTQNRFALTGNTATTSSRMVGVFGDYNVISNSNTRILIAGHQNSVNANASLVSGTINSISAPVGACNDSAAIGYWNIVAASKGWAIGEINTVRSDLGVAIGYDNIAGQQSIGSNVIQRAVAIGTGVRAEKTDSTALGRYNATMATNDVLNIGSGSNNNNRFTAFRVTNDGGVILGRAQGDISMGTYQ